MLKSIITYEKKDVKHKKLCILYKNMTEKLRKKTKSKFYIDIRCMERYTASVKNN